MVSKLKTKLLSIIAAFSFASTASATTIEEKAPEVELVTQTNKNFAVGDDDVYFAISSDLIKYDPDTGETERIKDFYQAGGSIIDVLDVEGSNLLYEQRNDLFLHNLNTEETVQVTNDAAEKGKAKLNKDGNLVTYSSKLYGDSDIFLFDKESGLTTIVANSEADEINPIFGFENNVIYDVGEKPPIYAAIAGNSDIVHGFVAERRGGEYTFTFLKDDLNDSENNAIVYMKPIGGEDVEGKVSGEFTTDGEYFILNNGDNIYSINVQELFN